jgi:hypothetical protein
MEAHQIHSNDISTQAVVRSKGIRWNRAPEDDNEVALSDDGKPTFTDPNTPHSGDIPGRGTGSPLRALH